MSIDKVTDPRQVTTWPGSMPVSHRYTAGLGGEEFFKAIRDRGVFVATRCDDCSVTYCPASIFCPRCLAKLDDFKEVGPAGTLESFTVVHIDLESKPLQAPQVLGLIKLDGADTVMVHRVGADPANIKIGDRVSAVFVDQGSRTGSLNDIENFVPA